ncbi:MAG: hypothetical protein IJD36_04585 [Clostridia bacterium]|nr:hypothetical protein [Clostridia bacterium]
MAESKREELARVKKKNEHLLKMVQDAREREKGYEQVAQVYSAYIAILLKRIGATEDNPVTVGGKEIAEALNNIETLALPDDSGEWKLFYREKK